MTTYPLIKLILESETLEYSGEEVMSADVLQEINPLSVELPISTFEFQILSTDESFSMFSGTYFDLLTERLPVFAYKNVDGDEQFIGKFYLSDWENISDHEFKFYAIDILGVLDATDYDGNFWSTATTLSEIIAATLDPINITYEIDSSIEDTELKGWIPPGNYREAIQQICFAAGATAITAGSSNLLIKPALIPTGAYDHLISNSEKLMDQPIKLQQLVTSIELVSHNYSQGADLETIFDEDLAAGSHKIIFEKPYYNIIVNGPGYTPDYLITEGGDYITTEGGDYIEVGGEYRFGPNCLYLELQSAGHVTVTGYPWVDSKRSFTFYESGLTEYANKNALKVADATMVNLSNAQTILNLLRDYYRLRYLQKLSILPSTEVYPRDIIFTNTIYDNPILVGVNKINTDLTGGCIMKVEALGIAPEFAEPIENPVRRARTGIAVCGSDLLRQNGFRNYNHE